MTAMTPKKRMGRPPKPSTERRRVFVGIRLTNDEHRKLLASAKRAGLSFSEYVRRKVTED